MSIEAEMIAESRSMGRSFVRATAGPLTIEWVEEWHEASSEHIVLYRNGSCASGDHRHREAPRLLTDSRSPATGPAL